jgi:hypothetical protein
MQIHRRGAVLHGQNYNNIRIKDMLPTKEQLKERMELLQKEMRKTKMLMDKNK